MPIKLPHIGENLIAEMLRSISQRGQLNELVCSVSGVSFADDIKDAGLGQTLDFLAEDASLLVEHGGGECRCDGMQKVDVLCAGGGKAIAIEAKLGETRMSFAEFQSRFCASCEQSDHSDSRLRGSMIAVLERSLPFRETRLFAELDGARWSVAQPWWLVVRKSVLDKWQRAGSYPVGSSARMLTFDSLAKAYGSRQQFDQMVHRVIGTDFAGRWGIDLKDP